MRKRRIFAFLVVALFLVLLAACAAPAPQTVVVTRQVEVTRQVTVEVTRVVTATPAPTQTPTQPPTYAQEVALQPIPLAGPLADRHAEISSMAWYKDTLIIVPQYPNFFLKAKGEKGDGALFAIPKKAIAAYLDHESYAPIEPKQVPFSAPGASEIKGFEGYESIGFHGDTVYMTIEVSNDEGTYAYLVSGKIAPDLSKVTLDTAKMVKIPSQSGIKNLSDEALIVTDDQVITFHEANGVGVNPQPVAHVFGLDLSPQGTIPMAHLEYRLTDATSLDQEGRFWVINYFWPGDKALKPKVDPLAEKYGRGPTHAASAGVERLVEMQYSPQGITLVDTPPIQLQLRADGSMRNWEAIVRFDDAGFLLATDKYPTTIFGFVPFPEQKK